ncbi:MAG: DUF61 family protein [Methanolobus sp.]|jgi:uncharacterized protein (UPF0216 family)|nr:DUF61 family protein [Methanolobus sp.]
MKIEIGKINDSIVSKRKNLALLLSEESLASITRAGKEHIFDRNLLQALSKNKEQISLLTAINNSKYRTFQLYN